jgi:hypothetical protein
MQIVAPARGAGRLFLDGVHLGDIPWTRSADYQVPFVQKERSQYHTWQQCYLFSQIPLSAPPKEITDEQRRDIALIRTRLDDWLVGSGSSTDSAPVRMRAAALERTIRAAHRRWQTLNIQRTDDGVIRGQPFYTSRSGHRPRIGEDVLQNCAIPLALDWRIHRNPGAYRRLVELFDHLHDQGWAEGSAMGTLDHGTLRAVGFYVGAFLIRDKLAETGRLGRVLSTMKWYAGFNEIFCDDSRPGTSADRMRTVALFRLICILMSPDSPETARDLRKFVSWLDRALEITPGWMGIIKPDYTGFHHGGIYVQAYAPHALHNAAFVQYLLRGTEFESSPRARANVRQAILTQRLMCNKYHAPLGVSGRMPFGGAVLNDLTSAYAYAALASDPPDRQMAAAAMRLWAPDSPLFADRYLNRNSDSIMYQKSIGEAQVMIDLAKRGIAPEPAPEGNWSKPYGALLIHRRDEWMVAVKGWSQYVWDVEQHADENVFGRYISYGTVQVLATGDPVTREASGLVEAGLDWNRIPGATAIHLPLESLRAKGRSEARQFSDETFVGGLSHRQHHGLFAMKLHDTQHDPSFRARKSVHLFDDLIVCLGSNIENANSDSRTETTLFQCVLPTRDTPIAINDEEINAVPFEKQLHGLARLLDPAGNGYVVPDARGVCVLRRHQMSIASDGKTNTEGDWASAWFDHGCAPRAAGYEYAVVVQPSLERLAKLAESPPWKVLQKDHSAHVLQHAPTGVVAYAIFEKADDLPEGPLLGTHQPCLVMVGEKPGRLLLSVADPDLRLDLGDGQRPPRNLGDLNESNMRAPSLPTVVRVSLRGAWEPTHSVDDIEIVKSNTDHTVLVIRCVDGIGREIELRQRPKD